MTTAQLLVRLIPGILAVMLGLASIYLAVRTYRTMVALAAAQQEVASSANLSYRDAVARAIRETGPSQNDLLHMPPDGRCPSGYVVLPKAFSRDGETWDGCVRIGREMDYRSIDFILGHEQVSIPVPIPLPVIDPGPSTRASLN